MSALNLDYVEGLYFIPEDMTWFRSEDKLTQFHEACHQFLHTSNYGSQCQIIEIGTFFAFLDMLRMVEHGTVSGDKFAKLGFAVINGYQLMAKMCENSMTVQESFANIYPYHFWHNELVEKGLIKDKERIDFVLDGVRKDVLTGSKVPSWYREIVKNALELYEKRSYEDFGLSIIHALSTPLFLEPKFLQDPDQLDFRGRTDINPDLRFQILKEELILRGNDSFKTVAKRLGIVASNPSHIDLICCFDIFNDVLEQEEVNIIKDFHEESLGERKLEPGFLLKHLPVKVHLDPRGAVDIDCCPVWLEKKKVTKSDVVSTKDKSCLRRIFVESFILGKPVPRCWAQPLADSLEMKIECQSPKLYCKRLLELVTKTIEEFAKITGSRI